MALQNPTTMICEGTFIDRDGRKARLKFNLAFSTPVDTAFAIASDIFGRAQAISDAALLSITLRYEARDPSPPEPDVTSDCRSRLALFYSNGVDIEPLTIPSPNPLWLEQSGSFAGIRLDLANPQVVQLADALTTALNASVGPDASVWGRSLVVGGLAK